LIKIFIQHIVEYLMKESSENKNKKEREKEKEKALPRQTCQAISKEHSPSQIKPFFCDES